MKTLKVVEIIGCGGKVRTGKGHRKYATGMPAHFIFSPTASSVPGKKVKALLAFSSFFHSKDQDLRLVSLVPISTI